MIPKTIHYCWFGQGELPQIVQECLASWHRYMPDWEYRLWNEKNFNIDICQYTREAYDAKKYAFVSDYARLFVLNQYGGLYLDVDFEVYKPFDELLINKAFAGFEGSKTKPIMMGVIASEPQGGWVQSQLQAYENRHFIKSDGSYDMTTNVRFVTDRMIKKGFVSNGNEQDFEDLHIYPVEYFCPRQTTGEYFRTENTYCEHKGLGSWSDKRHKPLILRLVGDKNSIRLIKLKRYIFG